jgi:hypothetical protein
VCLILNDVTRRNRAQKRQDGRQGHVRCHGTPEEHLGVLDTTPDPTQGRRRSPSACPPGLVPQAGAGIGPACKQVIGQLVADNAPGRLRAVQGIIGLAGRHDPSRLEAAPAKALAAGDPSYRAIKGVLGSWATPSCRRPSPPPPSTGCSTTPTWS